MILIISWDQREKTYIISSFWVHVCGTYILVILPFNLMILKISFIFLFSSYGGVHVCGSGQTKVPFQSMSLPNDQRCSKTNFSVNNNKKQLAESGDYHVFVQWKPSRAFARNLRHSHVYPLWTIELGSVSRNPISTLVFSFYLRSSNL